MAGFVKGDVVVVPFPYTDFTQLKRRLALVIATLQGENVILCQITSQKSLSSYMIPLSNADFEAGSLMQDSNIRPDRVVTIDRQLILYKVGNLLSEKLGQVTQQVIEILEH